MNDELGTQYTWQSSTSPAPCALQGLWQSGQRAEKHKAKRSSLDADKL